MPNTITNLSRVNIAEAGITLLASTLAPLSVFSTNFSANAIAPLTSVIVPTATGTSATLVNPTDYEQGSGSIVGVSVTMNELCQNWQLSNNDVQNGIVFSNIDEAMIKTFANKINDTVLNVVSSSNFITASCSKTVSGSAFSVTQLKSMRTDIAPYDTKNVVLDGTTYSQLLGTNLQSYDVSKGNVYGFNQFAENTRLDQSGTPCNAFVCSPSAIVVASGLPMIPDKAPYSVIEVWNVKGIDLPVLFSQWFSTKTGTQWRSLRVIIGAAKGNGAALRYFVSA